MPMAKAQKPEAAPRNLPGDAAPAAIAGLAEEATPYTAMAALDRGRAVIQAALKTIPAGPGVYRMLDAKGEVLYVGKAKSLRRRVESYARAVGLSTRILRMVAQTAALEVISTHTEVEALLLESNLIKRHRPRFNILLRDDKSYPFILLTGDHTWPQLTKHRGARKRQGRYFGPFASAGAVNRTLNTLQKAFPLRSCSDSVFEARTRPCLQYQIKRCTAPCVGRIDAGDYAHLVAQAEQFLSGRSQQVQQEMAARMQAASDELDFETAARYRDRLRALAHIQSHQGINVASVAEADVVAIHQQAGQSCVQVFFFRAGQNWGNRAYFPAHAKEQGPGEVLAAFLGQFYDDKPPPREVLVNVAIEDQDLLAEALAVKAGRKVRVHTPQRGERRELVDNAALNAREALGRRLAESDSQRKLLEAVGDLFGLEGMPARIEVYDNSHIQGRAAIGAMIVAGPEGFQKSAYRKFNIKDEELEPGDDYAMMREVLRRRFTRLIKTRDSGEADDADNARVAGQWPDLVLIDGGLGQLNAARAVFDDLGIADEVQVASIAKGPDRNAGREHLYLPDQPPVMLEPRSPVLYFLQRLRDEAHRFAIGTHRARRAKGVTKSALDQIAGVGPRRKRLLMNHFGSTRAIEQAALADLQQVPGISAAVAQKVYDFFRSDA
jgi:excinuclease ABC subunit C